MRTLATAKALVLGVAALALVTPGIASAQGKCAALRAMLSEDSEKLQGIGVSINRDGTLDLTFNGVPDIVREADDCDIGAPADGFDLDCTWRFSPGEENAAKRQFDSMLRRLNDCLPEPLKEKARETYTEEKLAELGAQYGESFVNYLRNNDYLRDFSGDYEVNDDVGLDISFNLIFDKADEDTRMSLSFGRY